MQNIAKLAAAAAISVSALVGGVASASVLTGTVSIDNGYTLYVSTDNAAAGTAFGSEENWEGSFIHSTTLQDGVNYYLHIFAYDTGGIAGVLGSFSLNGTGHHFADGSTSLNTDVAHWMGNQSGFSQPYANLTDLGPNGVGPWGFRPGISGDAHWIWSGDPNNNDASYLTAVILADAPAPSNVPEPATLALVGMGLLGMGRLRSKSKQG